MKMPVSRHNQRGVTLFVGMVMLVLITLMVTSAFMLSNSNLKAVGNMQAKDEANAAANFAIEQYLSSVCPTGRTTSCTMPADPNILVNIDNDGGDADYYTVSIGTPVCVRAAVDTAGAVSSVTLGAAMSTSSSWNTLWDVEAVVNDAKTGARTTVNVGLRVLLTQSEKNALCP